MFDVSVDAIPCWLHYVCDFRNLSGLGKVFFSKISTVSTAKLRPGIAYVALRALCLLYLCLYVLARFCVDV